MDDEVDRLYGLPLDEFVGARDELAKQLRAEDRREEAEQVKALRKPPIAVWLVNQVARERELDVRRLLDAAEALRKAQAAGSEEFAEARRDETHALERIAGAAKEIARREGSGQAAVDKAMQTVRAAAATDEGRELLRRGRLTEELSPVGFEALSGLVPAASRSRKKKKAPPAPRRPSKQARERVERLRKAEREAERAAERAEKEAARLREAAEAATAARARAEKESRGLALPRAELHGGELQRENGEAPELAREQRQRRSAGRRRGRDLDSRPQGRAHERPRAERVPARRHHDDLPGSDLRRRLRNSPRVLACVARVRVEQDLVAVPRAVHQLRLTGEENGVIAADDVLRVADSRLADPVQPLRPPRRVAEDSDQPHQRRLSRRKPNSVAMIVNTTSSDFLPRSFDSPLARSRMFTGTSSTRRPSSFRRSSASTSGASVVYGRASTGNERALTAYMPLVASRNGRRSATAIDRRSSAVPSRRGPDDV